MWQCTSRANPKSVQMLTNEQYESAIQDPIFKKTHNCVKMAEPRPQPKAEPVEPIGDKKK
jgi:hypothetical protein